MKIVGITGVGTYPVPWLKYGLASIYNVVDEIVVVNSGYNFPFFTEYDVPLPEVTAMMKELDVNGKIHEIQHVTWEKAAKFGPELDADREGIRALGMTYANDIAGKLGADWILRFDSDQVFFPNVRNIRTAALQQASDGYEFLDYKAYWLTPSLALKGGEVSHSDGTKFYRFQGAEGQRQFYIGEGAIMHYRPQTKSDAVSAGHFREVYSPLADGSPDFRGLLWYCFQRMMFHNFDQERLYTGKGYLTDPRSEKWSKTTMEEKIVKSFNHARHMAYSDWDLVPADPKAPPVIELGALNYINRGYPRKWLK